ncbi:MAG: hypothetical protein NC340_02690 [Ruminococcus flavefaciens]|nr:hypothetical protein [Ruminococcus flavefaciens]MCM1229408.1 hypothetical protein [Ruminococcus flavefaciens]
MISFGKITAFAVAVGMLVSLTACRGTNNSSESESVSSEVSVSQPEESSEAETQPATEIIAAEDGPRLYISNTTAKAGEYADVTVYVENGEKNWSFCGIHITFPDVLEVSMLDVEESLVDYERGEASRYSSGATAMLWTENMPVELTSNNLGCFFFAEMFADDYGLDGDIATFQLKIPDDAESGTVYPIGFYYMDTDRFHNSSEDLSLEKYTFSHLTEGSITVK